MNKRDEIIAQFDAIEAMMLCCAKEDNHFIQKIRELKSTFRSGVFLEQDQGKDITNHILNPEHFLSMETMQELCDQLAEGEQKNGKE